MKKVYHLSTCSTCQRILNAIEISIDIEKQDIKTDPITAKQLQEMKELAGSYEDLFSRRAVKFRSLGLNEMKLSENDYKNYILKEYTFLKRPVFIIDNQIFIGNAKSTIDRVYQVLKK